MTHDEAVLLLAELEQGRLGRDESEAVASHRAGCDECRALSQTYRAISTAAKQQARREHPDAERIVAYALDARGLAQAERDLLESHLSACMACSGEVETTRESHRSAGAAQTPVARAFDRRPRVHPIIPPALAAALAAVALGYPAFLGLVRLPELRERAETERAAREAAERQARELRTALDKVSSPPTDLSPAVTLHVLEGGTRGSGPFKTIGIERGQRHVLIGVSTSLPAGASASDTYRVQIDRTAGGTAWTSALEGGRLQQQLASSGMATFLIPAETLPPGSYRLTVFRGSQGEVLLHTPFDVVLRP